MCFFSRRFKSELCNLQPWSFTDRINSLVLSVVHQRGPINYFRTVIFLHNVRIIVATISRLPFQICWFFLSFPLVPVKIRARACSTSLTVLNETVVPRKKNKKTGMPLITQMTIRKGDKFSGVRAVLLLALASGQVGKSDCRREREREKPLLNKIFASTIK